ncbi:hypothetical protein NW752_004406 [Fusarium irregulare]|uniref:TPR-like protein n=1 Tax=Fusarium irregulare TaxID=2494466 RepID=A0A9W8PN42_9HYPO|nr:hypothetical protein NW766_007312 [Fusarium irregulare]KAJ4021398.1 hypothetical protein NW752_004406 [Fusarium irregulare]
MLFFQENEPRDVGNIVDSKKRQGINKQMERITKDFNVKVQTYSELNSMTWASIRRRDYTDHNNRDSDFWRGVRKTIEQTIQRAYPMLEQRFDFASAVSETLDLTGISSEGYSQPKPYETFIQSVERSPKTALDPTIDEGMWKALRDQAEARLESGDNERALAMFQQCLTMRIPYDDAVWEIKSSLAFAHMMLGHYARAERDLSELRQELGQCVKQNPGLDITSILLNHALALSRMGNYNRMKECLHEIVLPNSTYSQPRKMFREQQKRSDNVFEDIYTLEQQKYFKFAATVCRLRALAWAQQGPLDSKAIDTELDSADMWCDKLANSPSSFEPVRISNIVNRCRIFVLRGHYTTALSLLKPALVSSIIRIGETNPLTIETALLCSFLQIETGCAAEGRITCERCADVIEETLGNEHPFALEAEHILISASYREGAFLSALDDSISLHRRAESSAELGHKHPSTLKYKYQLGELYIENGFYSTAEGILAAVRDDVEQLWGSQHPEVLRARSQLALAQYHLGKVEIAEKAIFSTLRDQIQLYIPLDKDKIWLKNDDNTSVRRFINSNPPLLRRIGEAFKAKHLESAPHPDILQSLLTCGKILSRHPNADLDLALDIFHLVRDAGVAKLGQLHSLPLLASLKMGEISSSMAMGEMDGIRRQELYGQAMSSFDFIMRPDTVVLDPPKIEESTSGTTAIRLDTDHPIFLGTRQESSLASLLFSKSEPGKEYVLKCKDELDAILARQKSRPGQGHRQTVKTLLTLLTIALSFSEPLLEAAEIYEEILEPLANIEVERERYLECLLMRERVAEIIECRADVFGDKYQDLLSEIGRQVMEGEEMEDPSVRQAVRRVKERTSARRRST